MADMRVKCDCIGEDAKWVLIGVLNTAEIIGKKNLTDLEDELKKAPEVAPYQELALAHLKADLADVAALKDKMEKIQTCAIGGE